MIETTNQDTINEIANAVLKTAETIRLKSKLSRLQTICLAFTSLELTIVGNYFYLELGESGNHFMLGYSNQWLRPIYDTLGGPSAYGINIGLSLFIIRENFLRAQQDYLFYRYFNQQLDSGSSKSKLIRRYFVASISSLLTGIVFYLLANFATEQHDNMNDSSRNVVLSLHSGLLNVLQSFYAGYSLAMFFEYCASFFRTICHRNNIANINDQVTSYLNLQISHLIHDYQSQSNQFKDAHSQEMTLPLIDHSPLHEEDLLSEQPNRNKLNIISMIGYMTLQGVGIFLDVCLLLSFFIFTSNLIGEVLNPDKKNESTSLLFAQYSISTILFTPIAFMFSEFMYNMIKQACHEKRMYRETLSSKILIVAPAFILKCLVLIANYLATNSTLKLNAKADLTATWFTVASCSGGTIANAFGVNELINSAKEAAHRWMFFTPAQRHSLQDHETAQSYLTYHR